jgi:RNA polymerase sigma-70 factor (ECF subfamily)
VPHCGIRPLNRPGAHCREGRPTPVWTTVWTTAFRRLSRSLWLAQFMEASASTVRRGAAFALTADAGLLRPARRETIRWEHDSRDFQVVFEKFRLPVYRTIRGIVLDGKVAEDLAYRTFQRAHRRHADLRGSRAALELHRIAARSAISYVRRRQMARWVLHWLPRRAGAGRWHYLAPTAAEQALAALTPETRALVILNFYVGLAPADVAVILDLPEARLASMLQMAGEIMRRDLSKLLATEHQ